VVVLPALYDRTDEMSLLLDACERAQGGRPQLLIVSGHRRVGKTFLLRHLTAGLDHRAILFSATQQAQRVELDRLAQALQSQFDDEPLLASGLVFGTWERALRALVAVARRHPLTLVIDEAPYLAESTPGFASIVQSVWDDLAATSEPVRLTLILTGSAAGVMEAMIGAEGPLRGRVDAHLRLRPFGLPTVHRLLGCTPVAAIEAYAAGGGWPLHVASWDPGATTEHNLQQLAGRPGGILLEDADQILRELPDGPGFGRVLAAIGRGRRSFGDIAADAAQRIEYPLAFLADSGLIEREVPMGAAKRARPLYRIADPYLGFWFHMLYNERAQIESGMGDAVLRAREGEWRRHLGAVFEAEARAHAQRLCRDGDLAPGALIGRWWSTGRRPVEVDVLGLRDGRTVLIGEAKWAGGSFDPRWAQDLLKKVDEVPQPLDDPVRALWTRSVPQGAIEGVSVFSPTDMVEG
jgi:AAA+ ATPase superfamily predicted ATPase